MEDFEFVSPTHFVFGRGVEEQVGAKLAERGARQRPRALRRAERGCRAASSTA